MLAISLRFDSVLRLGGVACLVGGLLAISAPVLAEDGAQAEVQKAQPMSMSGMGHMDGHMFLTTLRPLQPGDKEKADAIAAAAKEAIAPYTDYHKALEDGYYIFLPNIPQLIYHFTKGENGVKAFAVFDPRKPTSLLYSKTADGGYKLVGAMYTDRVMASEDELNERIPLSIVRWHQHVNYCKAPAGHVKENFGPDAKFGLMGSIHTREACEAAGGVFSPHVYGWMVHVYPFETDPAKVWSKGDDDEEHANMDHSAMLGMEMK